MGLKEIIERLEPKIIQYLTIEKEVIDELYKELFAGTLDRNEWNDYYIKIVEQYGNPIMVATIKGYRILQDYAVEALGEENITKQLKELIESKTTATTTSVSTQLAESYEREMLESLDGKLYEPFIVSGIYICPKCKGLDARMVVLNSIRDDPDYLYYRCPKCKIDFRIINKALK